MGQEEQPDRREQPAGRRPTAAQPGPVQHRGRPFGIPVHVSPYWFVIAGVFVILYADDLSATQQRHAVRARRRVRDPALRVGAGARAVPLGGGPRLRPAGAPHPALPARRRLRDRAGGAHPRQRVRRGGRGPGAVPGARRGRLGPVRGIAPRHARCADRAAHVWPTSLVGVFNLLPGLPLDGGRILRAVIWKLTGKPDDRDHGRGLGRPGAGDRPAGHPVPLRRPGRRGHRQLDLGDRRRRRSCGPARPSPSRRPGSASGCPPCRPAVWSAGPISVPASTPLAEAIRQGRRGRAPARSWWSTTTASRSRSSTRPRSWRRRRSAAVGGDRLDGPVDRPQPGAQRRPAGDGPARRDPPCARLGVPAGRAVRRRWSGCSPRPTSTRSSRSPRSLGRPPVPRVRARCQDRPSYRARASNLCR